uniref:DUF7730 domain-containing protein n=1 Tax=Mycena chlorophos TaxID=658473 RepID=A0ABQ0LL59_MYCCL|nr:predicted protein [Mycena chlorophos]
MALSLLELLLSIACFPPMRLYAHYRRRMQRARGPSYSWDSSPAFAKTVPLKPLSSTRIDLSSSSHSLATQPQNCAFLRMPLELRLAIYEEALGKRHVHIFLAIDPTHNKWIVKSQSLDGEDEADPEVLVRPISVALLSTCRQIYTEAHASLFQTNIFSVLAQQLDTVMLCGLGEQIGRQHIRQLRIIYRYSFGDIFQTDPATRLFPQLAQFAALTHLTFVFEHTASYNALRSRVGYNLEEQVPRSIWGRRVMGLRMPQLKQLRLHLVYYGLGGRHIPLPKNTAEYHQCLALEKRLFEAVVGNGTQTS